MNLAPCPDCNRPISRSATACPHCGRPINPTDLQGPAPGTINRGGVITLVIIILLVILFFIGNSMRM
jgi:hypothetical protein